ncbi:GNAT family N-acetyltransferase [Xylanimonas oleitrophica]|uniref:GNAT family N-acetyltransferase n=1 Tax=Xylanimonas oleitrophica TaxID=2607479 RepID=UPI001C54D895|nr:GNAT family N-acetyltransferase [Xylanimonas oleitrophica]
MTTWIPEDVDELHRLHSDPVVMSHMTKGVQDREQTRARITTWIAEHRVRGWSRWRVEDDSGTFMGRAGFGEAHGTGHRELGYLLAPARWGAGYASELVAALVRWHFEHLDPARERELRAYVVPGNEASRRVLEKNGFRLVGASPQAPDQLVYACGSDPAV